MAQFFRAAAWVLVAAPVVAAGLDLVALGMMLFWLPGVASLLIRGLMSGADNRFFWLFPACLSGLYLCPFAAIAHVVGADQVGSATGVFVGLLVSAFIVSVAGMALDCHRADADPDADG